MALNLIKLCVGIDSIEQLRERIAWRVANEGAARHVTRMTPKRADELLDGGSLYWVIKRQVQARQTIMALEPVVGEDGIKRCAILLAPEVVATRFQPRRPFQGWRYLRGEDAPIDLPQGTSLDDMPPQMRKELLELGLL